MIVGGGRMGIEYYRVLQHVIKIENVTVITRSKESMKKFKKIFPKSRVRHGGIEKWNPPDTSRMSAIVAVNAASTLDVVRYLQLLKIEKILVEKPGGIDLQECIRICDICGDGCYMAFNRRFYPSVQELLSLAGKEGGVKSIHVEINDHFDRIKTVGTDELRCIELHNFCHALDLAIFLGGLPKSLHVEHAGTGILTWHQSWSQMVASGRSDTCLFSISSSLLCPGPWSLVVTTDINRYCLAPLETLSVFSGGSWEKIEINLDEKFKPGLCSMITTFLGDEKGRNNVLLTTKMYGTILETIYAKIIKVKNLPKPAPEVAIVGCGNIGSRMLQSMSKHMSQCIIHLVDRNLRSISTALRRASEVNGGKFSNRIFCYSGTNRLPTEVSICYVGTDSKTRSALATNLLVSSKGLKYLILEKVVFLDPHDFQKIYDLSKSLNVDVYCNINWNCRVSKIWKHVKGMLRRESGPMSLQVEGTDWGLLCNGLHMLDLFHFLGGSIPVQMKIEEHNVVPSKRNGYLEIDGVLSANSPNGDKVILSCKIKGVAHSRTLKIKRGNIQIICNQRADQSVETVHVSFDSRTGNSEMTLSEDLPLLSEYGHLILQSVLKKAPILPHLGETMRYHIPFNNAVCAAAVRLGYSPDEFQYT